MWCVLCIVYIIHRWISSIPMIHIFGQKKKIIFWVTNDRVKVCACISNMWWLLFFSTEFFWCIFADLYWNCYFVVDWIDCNDKEYRAAESGISIDHSRLINKLQIINHNTIDDFSCNIGVYLNAAMVWKRSSISLKYSDFDANSITMSGNQIKRAFHSMIIIE